MPIIYQDKFRSFALSEGSDKSCSLSKGDADVTMASANGEEPPKTEEAAEEILTKAEGESDDDLRLRNGWNGKKSHLVRTLTTLEALGSGCSGKDVIDPFIREQITGQLTKIGTIMADLERRCEEIVTRMPARKKKYDELMMECTTRVGYAQQKVAKLFREEIATLGPSASAFAQDPAAAASMFAQSAERGKIASSAVSAIRPDQLTADDTPAVYRVWKRKLEAYFREAGLMRLDPADQQIHFFAMLDHRLCGELQPHVSPLVPVMAPPNDITDTCLKRLDAIFNERHPVVLRRRDWMKSKRKPSEDPSTWLARHNLLGDEAMLHEVPDRGENRQKVLLSQELKLSLLF